MAKFLQHLELVLTLVGLLVIIGVSALSARFGSDPWQAAAIAGFAVGLLHGMLFWVMRQRRIRERDRVFRDIQRMLKDIINNQLAVISMASGIKREEAGQPGLAMAAIARSVETIHGALRDLSPASLERWRARYQSLDTAEDGSLDDRPGGGR